MNDREQIRLILRAGIERTRREGKHLFWITINDLDALFDELEQVEKERDQSNRSMLEEHAWGYRQRDRAESAEARLARVPALVEVLYELTWRGEPVGDLATCVVCHSHWPNHHVGCYIGDPLAAFEGEQ